MILPNNFSTTKSKLLKIWEQTETNRIQVDVQLSKQGLILNELGKSNYRTFDNTQIITLDTAFVNPIVFKINETDGKTQIAYQNWEIDFNGLLEEELIGCQINVVFRFGADTTYLPIELSTDADIFFNKVLTVPELIDSRSLVKKMLFGFYIKRNATLPEIDENNMQVSLNIRFCNPRYYN